MLFRLAGPVSSAPRSPSLGVSTLGAYVPTRDGATDDGTTELHSGEEYLTGGAAEGVRGGATEGVRGGEVGGGGGRDGTAGTLKGVSKCSGLAEAWSAASREGSMESMAVCWLLERAC